MVYKKISLLYVVSFLVIQNISTPLLGISLEEIEQEFAASPDKSPEDILDNISDEELLELLKSTGFDEELPMPTMQKQKPASEKFEPISSKPATSTTASPSSQSLEQTKKATSIIESTLTLIEQFLLHTQYIPELPGKIDSWVRQDKVREWQVDLTWEGLRAKIESLYYTITQLKQRDPITKEYRYIDTLIKDGTTYNTLVALQKKLHHSVPKLKNLDPFKPLSKKIRSEIKEILGSFTEIMYVAQLEKNLNTILEKYSGRAMEIKGQEDKAQKKAVEESKKIRKESAKKEVKPSKPASQKSTGKTGSTDYDMGSYNDYSSYYPSSGGGGHYGGGYQGGSDYDYPSSSKSPTKSRGKTNTSNRTSSNKDTDSETPVTPATPAKQEKKPETPTEEKKASKDLEKILDSIDNAADSIGELVDQTGSGNTKRYVDIAASQKQPNRSMMGSVESATLTINRARRLLKKISGSEKDAALRTIKDRLKKTELLDLVDKVASLAPTHNGTIALKNLGEAIKALYQKNYTPQTIPLIEAVAELIEAEPLVRKPAKKPGR
ncbi:MAG TPA: hypothetical protein VGT41_06325 [Candidatus Babeliales bacterium]|nr:hypothetical protein [Candidatus Babeliales bacterium]